MERGRGRESARENALTLKEEEQCNKREGQQDESISPVTVREADRSRDCNTSHISPCKQTLYLNLKALCHACSVLMLLA